MTIEEIIQLVSDWMKGGQTGAIRLNFFKGGISNCNIEQTIKNYQSDKKEGIEKNADAKSQN